MIKKTSRIEARRRALRTEIERWSERSRLLLVLADRVSLQFQPRYPFVRLTVENSRVHMPDLQDRKFEPEQKILYPMGYPNFVRPVWELWLRAQRVLMPVLRWVCPWIDVRLEGIEVYSIPHITKIPEETNVDHPAEPTIDVGTPIKLLSRAIRGIKAAIGDQEMYVENQRSNQVFTATVHAVDVRIQDLITEGIVNVTVQQLDVYTDVDHLPSQKMTRTWKMPILSLSQAQATISLQGPLMTACGSKELQPQLLQIPLAAKDLKDAICVALRIHVEPPFHLDPCLISSALNRVKDEVMDQSLAATQGNSLAKALLVPVTELWWNDLAVGQLTATLANGIVSGVMNSVGEKEAFERVERAVLLW